MLLLGGGDDGAVPAIPEVLVAEDGHTLAKLQGLGVLQGANHNVLVAGPLVLASGSRVVIHARQRLTEGHTHDEGDVVGLDDILPDLTGLSKAQEACSKPK